MVLEAVMILVDNSESSRNGDYPPTRFEAQSDAASVIFQSVTSSNPESSVGLMSIGGKGPEVLTTLTTDRGKLLDGLHRTKSKIGGPCHMWTALQVAFLCLKHRQNRGQRQRIVAFVCSPPSDHEARKLQDLSTKFKKNHVFLDIVLFGDADEDPDTHKMTDKLVSSTNSDKLECVQAISIKPSGKLLSDQLRGTSVFGGEPGAAGGGAGAAGAAGGSGIDEFGEFDFDPSMEPELALALRMSMEEERARQERQAREEEEAAKKASLEAVKEEDEPLLDKDGNPAEGKKDDDKGMDSKDAKDAKDGDSMDTS